MRTYDPALLILNFAGIPISGYADGTFVKVERDGETFAKYVGADGTIARSRTRNNGGKVTFTLAATSPCNDLLSAQAALDEAFGTGMGSCRGEDLAGTTTFMAMEAWIQKPPAIEFGKEIGTREWVIDCASLQWLVGGVLGLSVE